MIRLNRFLPRASWILLCLIAGGPCAFLALESLFPPAVLAFALLVIVARRGGFLPETVLAFAVSYFAVVTHFAIPDYVLAAQAHDTGNVVYAVAELAAATILLLSGVTLLALRRRPPARDRAA